METVRDLFEKVGRGENLMRFTRFLTLRSSSICLARTCWRCRASTSGTRL